MRGLKTQRPDRKQLPKKKPLEGYWSKEHIIGSKGKGRGRFIVSVAGPKGGGRFLVYASSPKEAAQLASVRAFVPTRYLKVPGGTQFIVTDLRKKSGDSAGQTVFQF